MKYILGDLVERNISFQVLISLLIVLVAIAGIDLIFLFLNELSDLSESYTLDDIFTVSYTHLTLPTKRIV